MQADLGVDDEQQQVGLVDRRRDLAADLDVHRRLRIVGHTAGVDQPERAAVPVGAREMAVARRARFFGDDGLLVADDAVEQRRLSDVRPADERDDGYAHAACRPLSTGSPSCASTSMKSYDGIDRHGQRLAHAR